MQSVSHIETATTTRPATYRHTHALVDHQGKCLTPQGFKGEVTAPSLDFRFAADDIGLGLVLELCQAFFPTGTKFVDIATFHARTHTLQAEIAADPETRNLAHGLCLPVPLPQLPPSDDSGDYGTLVDQLFGPAMAHAYNSTMCRSQRVFKHDPFAGQIGIAAGSRHEELVNRLRQGPMVGLMFFPLQGFSPIADREMIRHFPPGFSLSGVVDMATAIVAHTDTLLASDKAPRLDCAANTLEMGRNTFSLSVHPRPHGHTMALRCLNACDIYTGGVLYTGRT